MPEITATLEQELEIRLKMVPALIAAKGAGSSEVEALYLRAQELVDRFGEDSLRFRVLWGLWFVKYCRGQYAAAREAGERLLDVGRTLRDSSQVLEGHHAMWALLSAKGDVEEAVRHMEQGMAMCDRALHGSQAFYAGHDPGACARYHLAKDLWLLGHLDRSMTALNDAPRLAEELKHPMTHALTLWFAAWLHYHRRNRSGMRASLAQLVALTTEHGMNCPGFLGGWLV
jgi:tetratricopeptide (TPR) repeat protein